jgi:3',5'-cyclic AMP phosphodiesterase CpdA
MDRRRFLSAAIAVLLAICLSAALSLPAAQDAPAPGAAGSANQEFRFVQITDTHFGPPANLRQARSVVQAINALPMEIDFVVVTGDIHADNIASAQARKKVAETLGKLEMPVHYLPGNHDIHNRNGQSREATAKLFNEHYGPLLHQEDYRGVQCLFLYTDDLAYGFELPGHDCLNWLAGQIRSQPDKPRLIFHHVPHVGDFYRNRMHKGWPKNSAARWRKLITHPSVRAVVAGHFHRDEHHWVKDTPIYVSSSVAGYWGRQTTFRIYTFRDGRLSYRTQYIR